MKTISIPKHWIELTKLQTGEFDENIRNRVREKAIHLSKITDFQGLPLWLASYIIYDRHSEASDISKWKTPADIEQLFKTRFQTTFAPQSNCRASYYRNFTSCKRYLATLWRRKRKLL